MNDAETNQAARKVSLIEDKLDRDRMGAVALGGDAPGDLLGVKFENMMQVMEFAKLMSLAGTAIPPHLRGNPGSCLAITVRALELRMSPFMVANFSYETENRGQRRVAFESQFYHAVIEARAPLKDRLHHEIIGEGDERRCKVWATLKGETEPRVFVSDTLGKLRPPRNDFGQTKGSPLWDKKPDLQLYYNASRDFCRIYFPDVLGGLYTRDELEESETHVGPERAKDVTPGLAERLRLKASAPNAAKPEGFADGSLHTHITAAVAAATVVDDTPAEETGKRKRKTTTINETANEIADAGAHGPADAMAAADAQGERTLPGSGNPSPSAAVQQEQDSVASRAPLATVSEPAAVAASSVAGDATNSAENPPASVPADSKPAASHPPDAAGDAIEKAPTMLARERGIADRRAGKKRRDVPDEYRGATATSLAMAWIDGWEQGGRNA